MTTANGQTPAPFMQDAPAVISTLGTDAHQGLTSEQAAHNLNQYGPNAFTKPKPESMLSRIAKTAADPMLIMLMIAAAITLGVNITRAMAGGHADILECVGIFFAIALSVTITVVMEGRSAKAFEALNDINDDTTVTMVRDGEVTLVSQRDITIGDVLQISTGDKLPADARLIESNDLTADESALTGGDGITVFAKGSPEKMLDLCAVDAKTRGEIEREIAKFQAQSCRVLGFAHRHISDKDADTAALDYAADRAGLESGMMFDGFVAIVDPLREDVPGAVERCRKAGIELKMLTGDNIVTATAIANELGILDERHIAVEARQIEEMSDEELSREIGRIRVIARSTPVIKMRVVNALKAQGNVVAVTGDGINDAPAIKNADVGIAMGIAGTEVSKEASDIVMLDDSFATIVKAVHWGRGIYENFQRFIQFQLTVNLSSVVVVLASLFSGLAAPFTALQLLWVNIIMDGPPALTLGMEPIRDNLMDRRPTRRDAGIVSRGMLERIIVSGAFIAVVFMAQSWTNFMGGTAEQQSTILFTLFVVFQLFNAFNSRELGNASLFANLLRNKVMIGVFALMFALQVLVVQFGGAMFRTVPLPIDMWLKIIAVGFGVVVLQEVIKTVKRAAAAIRARRTANESDSQQPHQPIALDLVD